MEPIIEYEDVPHIAMINSFGRLNTKINLENMYIYFELDEQFVGKKFKGIQRGYIPPVKKNKKNPTKKVMQNQVTIIYKIKERYIKVKIFNTGLVHMPGMKKIQECKNLINDLEEKLKNSNQNMFVNPENLEGEYLPELNMINMQYTIKKKENLNKELIQQFIRKTYKDEIRNAILNPIYPALKILYKYNETKIVTVMIQSSGIIAMKGAKGVDALDQNYKAIEFINKALIEYQKSIII